MAHRGPGLGGFALVYLLAACQPRKPAVPPATATHQQQAEPQRTDGEGSIAPDAMKAMAALTGRWMMLGITDGAKEVPTRWHRHAASGTCMPKESASWELAGEQTYAPADESVSLFNEQLKTKVTLYTYPATRALDAEFDEAMQAMGQSCTEGPMMSTAQGDTHFGGCVRRLEDGFLLLEQVVLFQRGEWLHKARITFAAVQMGEAYDAAMGMVSQAFASCPDDASDA